MMKTMRNRWKGRRPRRRLAALLVLLPLLMGAGLRDFSGTPRTLGDFLGDGRWTVVMIWAADCPVCNEEVAAWDLFHDEHASRDARVVGLSIDGGVNEAGARDFLETHDPAFPSLIGTPQAVSRLLREATGRGLYGTPTFLLYDPRGRLAGMHVGALPVEAVERIIRQRHDSRHETEDRSAAGHGESDESG